MRMTIGKRLGLSFSAVLVLMVVSSTIVYFSIGNMNRSVERVVDKAFPTVSACDEMLTAVNRARISIRSYVMLGGDPVKAAEHKKDRQEAWTAIDAAVANLGKFYEQSTDSQDTANFALLKSNLQIFRDAQKQVEDIAHTDDNLPAYKLLLTETAPVAERVAIEITAMIDAEESLEATPERKKLLKDLADFQSSFAESRADSRAYLLAGNPKFKADFESDWRENEAAFKSIESHAALLMGKQLVHWDELKRQRRIFEPLPAKMFTLREGKEWNQAHFKLETLAAPPAAVIRDAAQKLKDNANKRTADERKNLDAASRTLNLTLLVATLLAVAVGAGMSFVLIRSIAATVRAATEMASNVAAASTEISTGSQQQVASLTQTATSLNEITTTAEEFKATMQEFADRARAVQEAANETAKQSAEGRVLTQESATRIEQVRVNSQAAGESVLKLAEQMQRIGEITATVNEIADQTKLLALNASIEAARAGEEGRGFAVVATQVRELANQSKEAAGRIESLISGTQKSMQDVVQKIESGSRLSDESTEIVRRMTTSFEEIAQAIQQTTSAMGQINTGAKQQEMGISELVSSITEIDSASKESLASAEQTRKSIVAIDEQIKRLDQMMTTF